MRNLMALFPCNRAINRICRNTCWRTAYHKNIWTHNHDQCRVPRLLYFKHNISGKIYFSSFSRIRFTCPSESRHLKLSHQQKTFEKGTYDCVKFRTFFSGPTDKEIHRKRTTLIYICAVGIFMVGMSYAGVPLYRLFCQATGIGGKAVAGHDSSRVENMKKVTDKSILVRFNADVASSMQWNFRPQQPSVNVSPGETALAFYTAKNPTDKPIIGISTYNVIPYEAGMYFNKIQCFCFEEQRLNPHEQVDMPVFFYIDPDFTEDPKLEDVDTITLSYTFFEAKDGLKLPLPGYATS